MTFHLPKTWIGQAGYMLLILFWYVVELIGAIILAPIRFLKRKIKRG